jgi:hypothetical protein
MELKISYHLVASESHQYCSAKQCSGVYGDTGVKKIEGTAGSIFTVLVVIILKHTFFFYLENEVYCK